MSLTQKFRMILLERIPVILREEIPKTLPEDIPEVLLDEIPRTLFEIILSLLQFILPAGLFYLQVLQEGHLLSSKVFKSQKRGTFLFLI